MKYKYKGIQSDIMWDKNQLKSIGRYIRYTDKFSPGTFRDKMWVHINGLLAGLLPKVVNSTLLNTSTPSGPPPSQAPSSIDASFRSLDSLSLASITVGVGACSPSGPRTYGGLNKSISMGPYTSLLESLLTFDVSGCRIHFKFKRYMSKSRKICKLKNSTLSFPSNSYRENSKHHDRENFNLALSLHDAFEIFFACHNGFTTSSWVHIYSNTVSSYSN
ncbi:hypothetical protein AGLY_002372 [Aphis glycines]|uniref:Uncharacterized protein n=1 Tax=Aphis glycines TaxID=307491 RepID=A0A6G0U5L5_APHGL|nr:hypothetical protein AGLY_002372 [Aphis glycines]